MNRNHLPRCEVSEGSQAGDVQARHQSDHILNMELDAAQTQEARPDRR